MGQRCAVLGEREKCNYRRRREPVDWHIPREIGFSLEKKVHMKVEDLDISFHKSVHIAMYPKAHKYYQGATTPFGRVQKLQNHQTLRLLQK